MNGIVRGYQNTMTINTDSYESESRGKPSRKQARKAKKAKRNDHDEGFSADEVSFSDGPSGGLSAESFAALVQEEEILLASPEPVQTAPKQVREKPQQNKPVVKNQCTAEQAAIAAAGFLNAAPLEPMDEKQAAGVMRLICSLPEHKNMPVVLLREGTRRLQRGLPVCLTAAEEAEVELMLADLAKQRVALVAKAEEARAVAQAAKKGWEDKQAAKAAAQAFRVDEGNRIGAKHAVSGERRKSCQCTFCNPAAYGLPSFWG